MTSSSPPGSPANSTSKSKSTGSAKKMSFVDKFKLALIVFLLVVLAGAGGYFFGTQQQFVPVVKHDPSAQSPSGSNRDQSTNSPAGTNSGVANGSSNNAGVSTAQPKPETANIAVGTGTQPGVKNQYWIHLLSGDAAMLSITVNGTLVNVGNSDTDITSSVRTGENKLLIEIRPPVGAAKSVDLELFCGNAITNNPSPNDATVLLKYFKNAANQQSSETLSFTDHG